MANICAEHIRNAVDYRLKHFQVCLPPRKDSGTDVIAVEGDIRQISHPTIMLMVASLGRRTLADEEWMPRINEERIAVRTTSER